MKHNWEYKRLGDVCKPKKDVQRANSIYSVVDQIEYIDISSIDRTHNVISNTSTYCFKDAPSRAQQCVIKGDVLVSLVRPNLKNIAIVDDVRDNLVASSGFCVLRGQDLLQKLIFYTVNSSKFTDTLIAKCAGAAYPAVKEDDVRGAIVPVPPMEVQERIVAELDRIDEVIDDCRELLRVLDALAQSLFYDYFGDPVSNPKGWEVKSLVDICNSISTGITYKPDNVADSGTIVLRSSNIQNSEFVLDDIVRIDMSLKPSQYVKKNDILMCSRNGSARLVGKVALIPELKESMSWGAFMTIIRSDFYHFLFQYFRLPAFREQLTKTKTTTVNQITIGMLKKIQLPVPPLSLQEKFAERIEQIDVQKRAVEQTIAEMQTLLNSRMDYWFN